MFDVGFWELVVIGVVGLLVLGPQRLPEVARQLGQWAGQARSMARVLKRQLREEMGDMDPRRIMDPLPQNRDHPGTASNRPAVNEPSPGGSDARPTGVATAAAATEDLPADPPTG